ncbi:MAG: lysoplasmalogenase [Myxococcota bacterium]
MGIIAGLVLALVGAQLWVARRPVQARWEWLFKPLASLGFVVLGVFDGWPTTLYGQVMVGGLVLAALGDVLLIPKDPRWFLAGLVSFLLGHVAYAAAFVVRGLDGSATLLAALGLGIVAVPIVRWLWPHVRRAMQGPVAAYMIVISAMVALAWGTYVDVGNGWIVAGAVGFYVSDIAVAKQRFVRASFATRAWGLPLYYAAQLVLAATVE